MADLLRQLEREHREAEKLMKDLEATEEPSEREELLTQLEAALGQHMEVEERVVYPVLAEIDSDAAESGESEHDGARELLEKMRSGGVDQPGFGALVAALQGAVGHHVEEEEGEIFPKLRKEAGADRFAMDTAPSGRDGSGGDVSGMTRDELYEKAKDLNIEGRSQMDKKQLANAVQAAGG